MLVKRTIVCITFLLFISNCTLSKDEGYNQGVMALNLFAATQTQAIAYVSNAGSSFGVNALSTTFAGAMNVYDPIQSLGIPTGILATDVSSGHILTSIPGSNRVQVLDVRKSNPILKTLNVGTNPGMLFVDPANTDHNWLMNDGDGTGADPILCPSQPTKGSFTVIHDSPDPVILASIHTSICIGLGPHSAASQTKAPFLAMITNQGDNTISVVDNDEDSPTFLSSSLLNTISLSSTPNGIVYSKYTNKFYTYLASGSGSIAVIDPTGNGNTGALGTSISNVGTKYSVLKIDSSGRYLLLSGTDTSTSPNKGLLLGIDLHTGTLGNPISVSNSGFSDIQETPDGKRLLVASASTDPSTTTDQLYVYSIQNLPDLNLVKSVSVGSTNQPYRTFSLNSSGTSLLGVFVPNYTDGTITVLSPGLDPIQTFTVGGNPTYTTVYSMGGGSSMGHMHMGGMNGM
ncbi:cell surface protein [Leptospira langatensis]|uniref:Cell surface protein n=1 Tax=Leptospira langatensis TaxID=2484983 RepID=A0A5F1ZRF1_9LEPT|nr:cell surface protein [Leptospira langatensis]TGK02545.1 cell surface protein [Leptospira langatensis]TGL40254.1 cell surface protein [Leptospira langatensis]